MILEIIQTLQYALTESNGVALPFGDGKSTCQYTAAAIVSEAALFLLVFGWELS